MGRYPWAEILLLEVLHIIVFYPTRHHVYRAPVLAAMTYLAAKIYLTPEFTDPPSITYTVGCAIPLHFAFTAYILFAEGSFPDHWRRVRDEVHTGADASSSDNLPSNFPLMKKLRWMFDIAYSVRMVGWVQEPQNYLPPHPPPSRRTFLCKTFLKLIVNLLLADISSLLYVGNPAFDTRLHDPADGPETYLAAVPLLYRVPCVLGYGFTISVGLCAVHNIVALVCVGLCLSSPTLWPDIWGNWGDAYTVRRLWGQAWHQRMRPSFAGLGKLVANEILKFPRGTKRSSYTQLYVAFFLLGALHSGGDFMVEKRLVSRSFKFFFLQAVAITFEDLVIRAAKRLLLRKRIESKPGKADDSWTIFVARVVGYFWVVLWFCLTVPGWVDESSTLGLSNLDRGPVAQFLLDVWRRYA